MATELAPEPLEIAGYRATLHFATARDDFDSVLSVYNYYGHAYRNSTPAETDADLTVRLFEETGKEVARRQCPVATGDTAHIRMSEVYPEFRGLVATTMVPRGRMGRLSKREGIPSRPIATSYFMLYERHGKFRDFSHELFLARDSVDPKVAEWASLIYLDEGMRAGVVIMNNRPLCVGLEYGSQAEIAVGTLDGGQITPPHRLSLPPGGSVLAMLDEVFPDLGVPTDGRAWSVVVRGTHIEQPMTIHLHASGDFNLHHF